MIKVIKKARQRAKEDTQELQETVRSIIDRVVEEGDDALFEYALRFDGYKREFLQVSKEEIQAAYDKISQEDLEDLKAAHENITAFAEKQKECLLPLENFSPKEGIFLGHRVLPVSSCMCYVPGGRFPLYSSALMLVTPAKAAGVKRVAAAAPVVHGTGEIHYKTLVAMDLAGADEIYAVGGAQAIAAFSYGTESIKSVDMIVGPGNRYVAEAKRQCYGQVGIDFVAGPSEVLVIADEYARADVVAADMLAQAEHDPNAKAILITTSEFFGKEVIAAVEKELNWLPTAETAKSSWDAYGEVAVVSSLTEAVALSNEYAPEHLEVNVANPDDIIESLYNYGSMFIGGNTAEVFGDYASGTNHTLPTIKASRYTGGVWVGTFLKVCTWQSMTPEASKKLAPLVNRLAEGEGLMAHAQAAKKRF